MGGNSSHSHLQQQELTATVCCLRQLCSQVPNSHLSLVFDLLRRSLQCCPSLTLPWLCPLLQRHSGGETDPVSGADGGCEASEGGAGGRKGRGVERSV